MNWKIRSIIAAVVLLALFAYRQFAHRERDPAPPATKVGASVDTPGATPAITRRLGQLAFTPCTLATETGTETVEALCSRLSVPEDHANPAGRKISLAIAWLPAKGERQPDPMFMLAGGPGQSALES
ncbi:MAG: alpha/beta hydrolase, partial [Arenimonas sp.]|nr:alpha/beta hydrolase [Arenimonas sp.]